MRFRADMRVQAEPSMANNMREFGRDERQVEPDGRLDAPAFHRNHQPIWGVLRRFLDGRSGDVLEAGSGTGQHVVYFARHSPGIVWWPSDLNERHLNSIEAWRVQSGLENIRPPQRIDLSNPDWSAAICSEVSKLTALFCANVVHIAPWRVAEGLFGGASRALSDNGLLFLYGPFKRDGKHTAVSNAVFDSRLHQDNPEWGVRDIAEIEGLADRNGLALRETVQMPANNLILVFGRASPD